MGKEFDSFKSNLILLNQILSPFLSVVAFQLESSYWTWKKQTIHWNHLLFNHPSKSLMSNKACHYEEFFSLTLAGLIFCYLLCIEITQKVLKISVEFLMSRKCKKLIRLREPVKYYFADFLRKGGTPLYGFFLAKKRSYGFGGYPRPPL